MTVHHATATRCSCGQDIDAITHPEDRKAKPGPGDLTVCAYCGAVYEYLDRAGGMRRLSESEVEHLPLNVLGLVLRIRHAVGARGAR